MRSNFWQTVFGITAFGESHSKAVGVVIEDMKPGIDFPIDDIQTALGKRRPGKNRFSSPRKEEDSVEVLSGVFEGKTTGMPICLIVYNKDFKSGDYQILADLFRPQHADLAYFKKYKIYDYRGGGRASGRETIARVIAGSLTNSVVGDVQIEIYPVKIGKIEAIEINPEYSQNNPLYWPCRETESSIKDYLNNISEQKESVGGIVEVRITNIPSGLGDPVFEKLDANIAKAILSIGSVKGIEFGKGFALAAMEGKEANQPLLSISPEHDSYAGGIYGGISTGEPVTFRFVVKPTPSTGIPQTTVNRKDEIKQLKMDGRFDCCIIPRIIPVAEAMIKLVLADAISHQRLIANMSSSLDQYREAIDKLDEDLLIALAKRKKITLQVAQYKRSNYLPVYNPEREQEMLQALTEKAKELGVDIKLIEDIWGKILEDSRGKQ